MTNTTNPTPTWRGFSLDEIRAGLGRDTNGDTVKGYIDHRFEVGSTYAVSWASDHALSTPQTVTARTARFVTLLDESDGQTRRVGVTVDRDGDEWCLPFGKFSMAPTLSADRVLDTAAAR